MKFDFYKKKKGQSAIEYLSTYGLMFIVLAGAIAIAFKMGLFGGQCTTSNTFTGQKLGVGTWSFINDGDDVSVELQNKESSTITLQEINATTDTAASSVTNFGSTSIAGGETQAVTFSLASQATDCTTVDAQVTYTIDDLGENATTSGSLTGQAS
jgi:hypothetical protein